MFLLFSKHCVPSFNEKHLRMELKEKAMIAIEFKNLFLTGLQFRCKMHGTNLCSSHIEPSQSFTLLKCHLACIKYQLGFHTKSKACKLKHH